MSSKSSALYIYLFIILINCICIDFGAQAQNAILSSGGDGIGTGGSFAYSVGQTMYTAQSIGSISISKGVQQSNALVLITGLEKEEKFGLVTHVFPNPAANFLIIEIKNYRANIPLEIFLFDAKGQQVHRQRVVDVQTEIQIEHLSSALYILKLMQENKMVKAVKVIKI